MDNPKERAVALVAAVDVDELTIRLLEIGCQMKRPAGRSSADLMADQWRVAAQNPVAGHAIRAHRDMAVAAIEFMVESINAGQRPS